MYKRQDIYYDYKISMAKAALGAEITVPTVDGNVKYKVPAGTQPGTKFRLKGKGVPHVNGGGRGNQYVHMVVEVPKHLNKEQEEALKAFMKASGESVDDIDEKDEGFFSKFKKKK